MLRNRFCQALAVLLFALMATTAFAFDSSSSFDPQSGNQYQTNPTPGGGTELRGQNNRTGSEWSQRTNPDGSQSGVDSDGNAWEYNPNTGQYRNHGTGETRQHQSNTPQW